MADPVLDPSSADPDRTEPGSTEPGSTGPDDPTPVSIQLDPGEIRAVPVTGIGHPLADRVGTTPGPYAADGQPDIDWVVTETRSRVVRLSPIRLNFLAAALRDGRVPVLVSDELSRLTLSFVRVWRLAGGYWVVREADGGLRNGFDGRRLDRIEDVWALPAPAVVDDLAVNHLRPVTADVLQLTAMVAMRHPARAGTRLGTPVTRLTEAVLGRPPVAWGPHEPVSAPWDPDALTGLIREQMPDEATVFCAGPGIAGSVGAQRTEHGVEELVHLTLALTDPTSARIEATRTAVNGVLQQLAETAMPLVAVVLAHPGPGDLLMSPTLSAPPLPLSLLIGAPAVRGFGLDPDALAAELGGRRVGRPRIPALLFDLGALEPQAWARLDRVLGRFDPDRLGDALGLGREGLRAAQLDRPSTRPPADTPGAGGADAQP